MSDFKLTNLAVNMHFPGNVAQLDDAGMPSLMVWIPAFKLSDVLNTTDDSIHPAFIVNGSQIPGFWYSKYQNIVHKGKAYSLPGEDPTTQIEINDLIGCCEAKGYGWHLSTAAEWAAIALWCKKNGTQPYGNNCYGRDSRESNNKAIPTSQHSDNSDKTGRVATGTGPLKWSHDNTRAGIWDMNGNVLEWLGGMRFVWGELQILAYNDAADPDNPQNDSSTCWKAINAADGSLVEPESKITDTAVKAAGNTVKLDYLNETWTFSTGISNPSNQYRGCLFANMACSDEIGDAAKLMLRSLAILPDEGSSSGDYQSDRVYATNGVSLRKVVRGGAWTYETQSGVFMFDASLKASSSHTGFRATYIPNI